MIVRRGITVWLGLIFAETLHSIARRIVALARRYAYSLNKVSSSVDVLDLKLVEERSLDEPLTFLSRDYHVTWRQQEKATGNTL